MRGLERHTVSHFRFLLYAKMLVVFVLERLATPVPKRVHDIAHFWKLVVCNQSRMQEREVRAIRVLHDAVVEVCLHVFAGCAVVAFRADVRAPTGVLHLQKPFMITRSLGSMHGGPLAVQIEKANCRASLGAVIMRTARSTVHDSTLCRYTVPRCGGTVPMT